MSLSPQQIDATCREIERRLAACRGQPDGHLELAAAVVAFRRLRDQWAGSREAMRPFVDRLRDLGEQIRLELSAMAAEIAASYLEAAETERNAREQRKVLRDALLELTRSSPLPRLDVVGGWVELVQAEGVSIPRAGSPEREALEEIVTSTGAWSKVGQLNPARLLRALKRNELPADVAARITDLCPLGSRRRVVGHLQRPASPSDGVPPEGPASTVSQAPDAERDSSRRGRR